MDAGDPSGRRPDDGGTTHQDRRVTDTGGAPIAVAPPLEPGCALTESGHRVSSARVTPERIRQHPEGEPRGARRSNQETRSHCSGSDNSPGVWYSIRASVAITWSVHGHGTPAVP
jgi:hypothetical protein